MTCVKMTYDLKGISTKFPDLWDVKIEKNMCQRKQSYMTIFTWFDNLLTFTKLQGFHYSQRKKKKKKIQDA